MNRNCKAEHGAIIVWDTGKCTTQKLESGQTFFEASQEIIKRLISNKILVQQKDLVSVIKFGTEETHHDLDQDGFDHINVKFKLQTATFEMLEDVESTTTTNIHGDWLGALCVGLQMLRTLPYVIVKKIIVLVSPLSNEVDEVELQHIIKGTAKIGAQVIIIGPEMKVDVEQQEDKLMQEDPTPISHALMKMFAKVPGQLWNFPEAMVNLTNGYTSRLSIPRPWKVNLEIGPDLQIKVQGYNEIEKEKKFTFTSLTDKNMEKKIQKERAFFEKGNKRKFVDQEEVIQGHKFGTTIVPFSKEDKQALQYNAGAMCLKVIAFVPKAKISPAVFFGACQMFVPVMEDPVSRVAFSALVRAMHELQMAALVRKVVRLNGRLIFAIMLPQIRVDEGPRLILIQLPFADDARLYRFKRSEVKVTDEQLEAIDELIDRMDLMTAMPNKEEAFGARETSDPTLVYMNQCLIERALHPDDPMPPVSAKVLEILSPPASMQQAQRQLGPKLAAVFPVETMRKRFNRPGTTRKIKDEAADDGMLVDDALPTGANTLPRTQPLVPADAPPADNKIIEVGSVTPADDFNALVRQGRDLKQVCQQCFGVVLQLATLAASQEEVSKPLAAVRVMRNACKRNHPSVYNNVVRELKTALEDRERLMLWEAIQAEQLGLITRHENPLEGVSDEEASEFLNAGNAAASMTLDMDDIM